MENHIISMEGRRKTTITAVTDVENFTDECITVLLETGGILLKGKNLHVQSLDLKEGKLEVAGEVHSLTYVDKKGKKKKEKREKWSLRNLFGSSFLKA